LVGEIRNNNSLSIESPLNYIIDVLDFMMDNLGKSRPEEWVEMFRKRGAEEIIKSGFTTGCTDSAIVFCTLVRAAGYPTKYIEVISKRWLDSKENEKKPIKGHVFAEVMVNKDRWILIDPDSKKICIDSGREWEIFEIYDVGLDSHDFGLTSFAELKKKFFEYREKRNSKK